MEPVQPLKGYSTHYGFDPDNRIDQKNILTIDQARALFENGQKFSLLFGDPTNPDYHIEVFQRAPDGRLRIDVDFYLEREETDIFNLVFKPDQGGDPRPEMLMAQASVLLNDGQGPRGNFFITDAFVDGDFPRLTLPGDDKHAISVPWQDFFIGPIPSFDDLLDGSFVARLPKLSMPSDDLLDTYIPQIERKPTDPKRTPKGRFPW